MIITIAHDKGGTGKSLTVLNLLATIKPDIAIDLDTRKDLTLLNNLRATKKHNVVSCHNRSELISALRQTDNGKMIIVDCGGFDSELTRIAIGAGDLVITPCNGSVTERNGLKSFSKILAEISKKLSKDITGHVLFNRTEPNQKNFTEIESFVKSSPNLIRLNSVIARRTIIPKTAEQGLGVIEINGNAATLAKAKADFETLTKEIKELL
jgi:chromosome partitioning protein